jgi:hypothetical protein
MPWIANFNETGTHARGIFKRGPTEEEWKDPPKLVSVPRDYYIKVRIDLYPAKEHILANEGVVNSDLALSSSEMAFMDI